jgi:hypothetical protein
MEVFGFHTIDEIEDQTLAFCGLYYNVQNVLNVLGWIPVLGTITAGARIGSTIGLRLVDPPINRERHRFFFIVSTLRGVVEFLSLGWVFVVPDIVVTANPLRYFHFKRGRKPPKRRRERRRRAPKRTQKTRQPRKPTARLRRQHTMLVAMSPTPHPQPKKIPGKISQFENEFL